MPVTWLDKQQKASGRVIKPQLMVSGFLSPWIFNNEIQASLYRRGFQNVLLSILSKFVSTETPQTSLR